MSATSTTPGPIFTKVYFRYLEPAAQFGETVHVVGNAAELGSWDPSAAPALATNEENFPCWTSSDPVLLPLNKPVEYKYAIRDQAGNIVRWSGLGNRRIVPTGPTMTVEDDDGHYRQIVLRKGLELQTQGGKSFDQSTATYQQRYAEKLELIASLEPSELLSKNDTVVFISLQLPLKAVKDSNGQWSVTPSNAAFLPSLFRGKLNYRVMCVGWPGVHVESPEEEKKISDMLYQHDCIPVFPPRDEFEQYMEFCSTFMWPVFHDVMHFVHLDKSGSQALPERQWAAYQRVNALYANAVVHNLHEEDLLWIQDFHLLLLPQYITRKHRRANVGLFLHCPFPSLQVFQTLPVREQLVHGMLCCDMIGFQFFAYVRNFLIVIKRVLGIDHACRPGGYLELEYSGRKIMIRVGHVPLAYEETVKVLNGPVVKQKSSELERLLSDKIVFAGVDRCGRLSGLMLKMKAFRLFLQRNPQYQGKVVLVQYAKPFKGIQAEQIGEALKDIADVLITSNGDGMKVKFKESPETGHHDIYVRVEDTSREDRLTLWRRANVMIETSLKDGLNLMPFEYVACHENGEDPTRVTIVSEFSGCSRVLQGAIRVNPWNAEALVAAMYKALTMKSEERRDRFALSLSYTCELSPVKWAEEYICDLRRARKKEDMTFHTVGFGANMRILGMDLDFRKLSVDDVVWGYRNSFTRVFLLDNEGTLAPDIVYREYGAPTGKIEDLQSHGCAPSPLVIELLKELCRDSRNTVVILSGRDRQQLESWFGEVENLGLAAEHGFYYRLPTLTGDQWYCISHNPEASFVWKPIAFDIMKQFVTRTQGSFIENKGSALVWQYRDADPEFGAWQSQELSSALGAMLFGYPVQIAEGKGYVEVKLLNCNKGVAVAKVLSKVATVKREADFVLCLGDDRSDEPMFEVIKQFLQDDPLADDTASTTPSTTEGSESATDRELTPPQRSYNTHHWDRRSLGLPRARSSGGWGSPGRGGRGCHRRAQTCFPGSIATDLAALGGSVFNEADSGSCDEGSQREEQRRYFTCTVGKKPSEARFYLDDADEVSELLSALKVASQKPSREYPLTMPPGGPSGFRVGQPQRAARTGLQNLSFGDRKNSFG